LMCRATGATIEEIAKILAHEPHTTLTENDPTATSRGFLSALRQKYALQYDFTSDKDAEKVRRYYARTKK
jgi:hypothetical protein